MPTPLEARAIGLGRCAKSTQHTSAADVPFIKAALNCGSKLHPAVVDEDPAHLCKHAATCLSMLSEANKADLPGLEGILQVGILLEERGEKRLAWEVLFGLVKHFSVNSDAAPDVYAHAVARASALSKVGAHVDLESIPVLCFNIRKCFLQALKKRTVCKKSPSARKLFDWLVHVTARLPPEGAHAVTCWCEVRQALQEGGQQVSHIFFDGISAEEQTQLLRLIGHHAKLVRPEAAEFAADVLQILVPQDLRHLQLLKPNEAAVWLKTLTATVDVLINLPTSQPKSLQVLDWTDDYLTTLSTAYPGDEATDSMQRIYLALFRSRLRAMEAFRKANSQIDLSRADIFEAWKKHIVWQFGHLAHQSRGKFSDGEELPSSLQPLFGLCGLLERTEQARAPCDCAPQTLELIRLQLPPGPLSALVALRQLQMHCSMLSGQVAEVAEVAGSASVASFGRLVMFLIADPDFRAAVDSVECFASSGSLLALRALHVQLERYISLLKTTRSWSPTDVGTLRILQAQASAQSLQMDPPDQICLQDTAHYACLALDEWQNYLGLDGTIDRRPMELVRALQPGRAIGHSSVLLRQLFDAAGLLEMLDLHGLSARSWALSLACAVCSYGSKALWWHNRKPCTLPRSACEVCVALLYRLAAACGRAATDHSVHFEANVALEWWEFAEVARAALGEAQSMPVLAQQISALSAMPERTVCSIWQSGGDSGSLGSLPKQMTKCDTTLRGQQDSLMFAEAFWAVAKWSAHWQDIRPGQCAGGSTISAQSAALRSLKLVFHCPKALPLQKPVAEDLLVRWPAVRSGLLQLRILYQVSLLYRHIGESDLAAACAECGLKLMSKKLCGDNRWKLRFLCMQARCSTSRLLNNPKESTVLGKIEELWNDRIKGHPAVALLPKKESMPITVDEEESATMPSELLALWVDASLSCASRRASLLRWLLKVSGTAPESGTLVFLTQLQMENSDGAESMQHVFREVGRYPPNSPKPRPLFQALAVISKAALNNSKKDNGAETTEFLKGSLCAAVLELERCCTALASPALLTDEVRELRSFDTLLLSVFALRGAVFTGDSAAASQSAHLLLDAANVPQRDLMDAPEEQTVSRSRSPRRGHGLVAFARARWQLCKQVVPFCSGASLIFLAELRAKQRRLEKLSDQCALGCLLDHSQLQSSHSVPIEDLCSGNWMSQLTPDMSLAWLQVDWRSQSLQITRSLDAGCGLPAHSKVLSQRVEVPSQLLHSLREDLQSLHELNSKKIRELWQREDKRSEAVRLEFWQSRKSFDGQLGRVAERIQKEVLRSERYLLAPWPQSEATRQRLLDALRAWLNEAEQLAKAANRNLRQQEPDPQHFFLLALLFIDCEHLEVSQLVSILGDLVDGSKSILRRLAYSMRRCRSELQALFKEPPEAPLLLYVDASMAQLPLEACPSLRHRNVVRGLAPNITLAALSSSEPTSTTGFFVIDPAEDCAAMVDVRQLLTSWTDGQAWHGHTGRLPEPARVLEELCKKDIFVYLGHGEKARHLLRQEMLQVAGSSEKNSPACQAGLRSILMLLGCSSVKIQNASTFSQDESFGLVSSALLGGAPLVLGAQWDVLGGDLDKLASRLLQRWLKEGKPTRCGGLLAALKTLRPNCLLPNLTGAALVCYGIPV